MQRIRSQEEIERGKRRNKVIVGFVFIFLMVFSTAGFALYGNTGGSSSDNSNQEGPYYNGQYWIYSRGGQQFYFTYSPDLVKNVPIDINLNIGSYVGTDVYIVSDNNIINGEIANNLGQFVSRLQKACFGECEEDLPEKDCTENLIVYTESEENRVYQEESCVFIDGGLIAVDAFLYKMLGFS